MTNGKKMPLNLSINWFNAKKICSYNYCKWICNEKYL